MIIIIRVINIIGKLFIYKRYLYRYILGLNIFVFDINVGFKKKIRKFFLLCLVLFGFKGNGIYWVL